MADALKIDRARFAPLVSQLAREWRRAIDGRLHAYGLTEATWLPLLRIARSETPMRQNELAASLSLDGSSVVRLIDALEKAGLVNRREDALDRRAKSLVLTARGQRTVDQVERVSLEVRDIVLGDIPDDDFARALRLLECVKDSLLKLSHARLSGAERKKASSR
jgi:MarR family transcriptional regulator for hemolysin